MYQASEKRYDKMIYNRCGKSGLLLSAMSLLPERLRRILAEYCIRSCPLIGMN